MITSITFPRSKKGFTLIELLVVVSIIGILAAIALPIFANVQRKARQVQSMSNLKQWGSATLTCAGEHNGQLPWEGQPIDVTAPDPNNPSARGLTAWYNLVPPYVGEKPLNAMVPGEYPRAGQKSVWVNPATPTSANVKYTPFLFCYAMNDFLSTDATPNLPLTQLEHSAATVLMAETGDDKATSQPTTIQALFGTGDPLTSLDNIANFVFCDGHVASFARRDFDPTSNPKVLDGSAMQNPGMSPNSSFTYVPSQGAAQQ